MTQISDEAVVAFVDGRLEGAEKSAFEAVLARDAALAERVAAHRWLSRQIVGAYAPPREDAMDDAMLARLGLAEDNIVEITAGRTITTRRWLMRAGWAGSIAASLVLGLLAGATLLRPEDTLLANTGGHLVARGQLANALTDTLSGAAGPVHIGLSFRTDSGICRTFRTHEGISGMACRRGTDWIVPVTMTEEAKQAPTEYQLAGGDVPPAVMAEVDRRIEGQPLTTGEEERLRSGGWR